MLCSDSVSERSLKVGRKDVLKHTILPQTMNEQVCITKTLSLLDLSFIDCSLDRSSLLVCTS